MAVIPPIFRKALTTDDCPPAVVDEAWGDDGDDDCLVHRLAHLLQAYLLLLGSAVLVIVSLLLAGAVVGAALRATWHLGFG